MIAFNYNDIVFEPKQLIQNHLLLTKFYPVRFLKWPLSFRNAHQFAHILCQIWSKQLCCCYTVKSQLNWMALKEAPAKTTNCEKPELIIAGY